MSLQAVTLGVAICEADHKVVEEGTNWGPRVREYLRNCDPPINVAAPWCAAFLAFVSDVAARGLGVANPLDSVRLEAYVQSYYQWAKEGGRLISPQESIPGDLVLYNFRNVRWDHIGLLITPPDDLGFMRCVEGNTNDAGSRDGDGVYMKIRSLKRNYPVAFVRWAA